MRLLSVLVFVIVTADVVRSQKDNLPPTQTKKGKRPARLNDYQTFQEVYRKTGGAAIIRKPGIRKPIPRPPQKNADLQTFWQNKHKSIRHPEVLTRDSNNANPGVPVSRPAVKPKKSKPWNKQPQPKPAPINEQPVPIKADPVPTKVKPSQTVHKPAYVPKNTKPPIKQKTASILVQEPGPIKGNPPSIKPFQTPVNAPTLIKSQPVKPNPANWGPQKGKPSPPGSQKTVKTNKWTDNVDPSKPILGKMPPKPMLQQNGKFIHPPVLVSKKQGLSNQINNQVKPALPGNMKKYNPPASFINQQKISPEVSQVGPNNGNKIDSNKFIPKSPAPYQKPQPVKDGKEVIINKRVFKPAGMRNSGKNQEPYSSKFNAGNIGGSEPKFNAQKQSIGPVKSKEFIPRKFGPPVFQNNKQNNGISNKIPGKAEPPMPQGRFGNGPWANDISNGKVFKPSVLQRPIGQNKNNKNENNPNGNNNNKPNGKFDIGNNNDGKDKYGNKMNNNGGAEPPSWQKSKAITQKVNAINNGPPSIQDAPTANWNSKPLRDLYNPSGQLQEQQGGQLEGPLHKKGSPIIKKSKQQNNGEINYLPTKYHPAVLTRPKKLINSKSKTNTNKKTSVGKQAINGQTYSGNKQVLKSENGENGKGASQTFPAVGNGNGDSWNKKGGFPNGVNNNGGATNGAFKNNGGIPKGGFNNNGKIPTGGLKNNGGIPKNGFNNNGKAPKGGLKDNGTIQKGGAGNKNAVGPKGYPVTNKGGDTNGLNNNGNVKKVDPGNKNGGAKKTAPSAGPIKQPCAMNPICGSDSFTYMSECFMSAGIYKVCDGFCPCPPTQAAKSPAKPFPFKTKTKAAPKSAKSSIPAQKKDSSFKTRNKSGPPPTATAEASEPSSMPCKCTRIYKPVCGENGETYSNDCLRRCNGIRKACSGSCPCKPSGPENTPPVQPPVTVRPYTCADFCPQFHKPVCSAWGHTFSNDCVRECSGEPALCNGACPCLAPVFLEPQPVKKQVEQDQNNNNNHHDYNYEPNNQPLSTCECLPGDIDPVCTMDGETLWYGCQAICLGEKIRCSSECPC